MLRFPNDVLDGFPAVWIAHFALQHTVAVDALAAYRPPRLRPVALPEAGTVGAHIAGLAEVPRHHAFLEAACRARHELGGFPQPEFDRLVLHRRPSAPTIEPPPDLAVLHVRIEATQGDDVGWAPS